MIHIRNYILVLTVGLTIGIAVAMLMVRYLKGDVGIEFTIQTVNVLLTTAIALIAFEALRVQVRLHAETNRPLVACDLVIEHSALYLRIRNWGNSPARDVEMNLTTLDHSLDPVPFPNMRFTVLMPGNEFFFVFRRQSSAHRSIFSARVRYSDWAQRSFEEASVIDTTTLDQADVGRENNSPTARGLREIAKTLQTRTSGQ